MNYLRRQTVVGVVLGLLATPGLANLIANGDFEAGLTGFTTDYIVGSGDGSLDAGELVVLSSGQQINVPSNISYPDHTTGSGSALYVNGSTQPGQVVLEQTVAVSPGETYRFSFFYTNFAFGRGNNDATLSIRVNGEVAASGIRTRSAGEGPWLEFAASIAAGTHDALTIGIVETSLEPSGNDFVFDDLTLTQVPTPASLLPLGLLAFYRRR